ncbi:MAG: PIN domain-containing protein [Acidobacteria bacterium]|nr:PIN domain-containing protein [Acidobacteriota bacterium]
MALVRSTFFDTSALIAGLIELGPASMPAQLVMDRIAEGRLGPVHSAWHCCLEFYAVSTRLPPEFRLSPSDALRLIEEEILARFKVHQLPADGRTVFLHAAQRERVAGGRIYDAHIAEIARLSGATAIVTDNRRHFSSLLRHGIPVMSTAEFAEQMGP